MDYDETLIDRDIRSLYRTGLFETIEVHRAPVSRNQVDVIFEVRAKYRVGAVRFEGNKRMSTRKLEHEITIRQSVALDEAVVKTDTDKLKEFYRKAGFSQVRVDYVIERNPVTGLGTVLFKIEEGPKVHIKDIVFVGNTEIKGSTLRRRMDTAKWAVVVISDRHRQVRGKNVRGGPRQAAGFLS